MPKVVVIGGGPAGMMAAITAAENGNDVLIIEKMPSFGKKLLIQLMVLLVSGKKLLHH